MADKHPVQADGGGKGGGARQPDGVNNVGDQVKAGSTGESGGGAYSREGSDEEGRGDFGSRGGQSEQGYHGPGQLGDEAVGKDEGRKGQGG